MSASLPLPIECSPFDSRRTRVLGLLRRFGEGPTSFQILEPGLEYWFDPQGDAVVAYVIAGRWRVVAGQPVASPHRRAAVVRRFLEQHPRTVFFGVESSFLACLEGADLNFDAVQIAEQPDWDPRTYTIAGSQRRSLRSQVNRARNKGVGVRRVGADELVRGPSSLRPEIEAVLECWRKSRRMHMMRFMVDLAPFGFPAERRYYVAEVEGRLVGFLAAVPVYARSGWFFEDVIRIPEAPNGTAEMLIHTAMEDARVAGDAYVTLGMAPLAGIDTLPGPHRGLRRLLVLCRARLGTLYSFDGIRRFKARFRPTRWTPQYMVVVPGPLRSGSLCAVLRAFSGGGLLRFGFETGVHLLGRLSARVWASRTRRGS